ncbi:MAG: hypothetical protein A2V79_01085 [Betaproteobacteria bacterium RBG_16_56_24]|nr:MAG: hypothetical protein A2V79_01085 [Betaproteobacteria bacterium RBG_16_56_24]
MRFEKLRKDGSPDGMYLVVKDDITEGDLETLGKSLAWGQGIAAQRGSFVRGAIRAGLILEASDPDVQRLIEITQNSRDDKVIEDAVKSHRSPRAIQWYGLQLTILYNDLTSLDPN